MTTRCSFSLNRRRPKTESPDDCRRERTARVALAQSDRRTQTMTIAQACPLRVPGQPRRDATLAGLTSRPRRGRPAPPHHRGGAIHCPSTISAAPSRGRSPHPRGSNGAPAVQAGLPSWRMVAGHPGRRTELSPPAPAAGMKDSSYPRPPGEQSSCNPSRVMTLRPR